MRITTATGSSSAFMQAGATVPVNVKCKAPSC
jgi:hypothetical protein